MNFISTLIAKLLSILPCFPVFAGKPTARESAVDFAIDRIKDSIRMAGDVSTTIQDVMGGGNSDTYVGKVQEFLVGIADRGITALASLGVAIALALWLVNVIDLAMQERLTMETFIKSTARLVFAATLCDIAPELYAGILDFGEAIGNQVAGGLTSPIVSSPQLNDQLNQARETMLNDESTWFLSYYIQSVLFMLPMILSFAVVTIITYIIQFSRLIELNVRAVFLPIALGSLVDDGWKGAGGRYIRKFIAICAQVAVLIVVGTIMGGIISACMVASLEQIDGIMATFEGLLVVNGCMFAGIGVMFKSMGIVSDVFGA